MSALRRPGADQARPQAYVSPQRTEEASPVLVTDATGGAGRQALSQLQDRGAGASRSMLLPQYSR
jgi:hypothetical protein